MNAHNTHNHNACTARSYMPTQSHAHIQRIHTRAFTHTYKHARTYTEKTHTHILRCTHTHTYTYFLLIHSPVVERTFWLAVPLRSFQNVTICGSLPAILFFRPPFFLDLLLHIFLTKNSTRAIKETTTFSFPLRWLLIFMYHVLRCFFFFRLLFAFGDLLKPEPSGY